MDINEKIAARREQLAREERQAKADQAVEAARVQAEQQLQRIEALDAAASRLSTPDAAIRREGNHLAMTPPPPPIDPEVLTVDEAIRLLRHRAREMWTPRENWIVVGGIASLGTIAGIGILMTIAASLAGIALIVAVVVGLGAIGQRVNLNRKYLELARADYPVLANAADGRLPPDQPSTGSVAQT